MRKGRTRRMYRMRRKEKENLSFMSNDSPTFSVVFLSDLECPDCGEKHKTCSENEIVACPNCGAEMKKVNKS